MVRISPTFFHAFTASLILLGANALTSPVSVLGAPPADESRNKLKISHRCEPIELADYRGKKWDWNEIRGDKATVIVFLGAECPLVTLYASRLDEMHRKYAPKGVSFVGVNSNQHDSLTEITQAVRTHGISFPMLKDPGNRVADVYRAERTPEVFVVDSELRLRYHGRIDDQYTYGIQKPKITRAHLQVALDEIIAGKTVSVPETEIVGCHIGRLLTPDEDSKVTYANQVSRILQKRCVVCHREGEIAPFGLTEYDEVVGWAEMIAEVVEEERMPPWHANPAHGEFSNDARLTDKEKQTILDWVAAGGPKGDPANLPEPVKFIEGWRIPKPDLIINMRNKPFKVKAEGEVRYQHFVVDPKFKEDKWIQAAECRPGNRAVVHHIIVAAMPPDGQRHLTHGDPRSEWISATAPGAAPLILEKGQAKRIPAGSKLLFQLHYTPIGVEQEDLSCVGFVLADPKDVKKEVFTQQAVNRRFVIPAGNDNYEVTSTYPFKKDSHIHSLFPHMHLRGKSFRYNLIKPDGSNEILLDIPRYDFNWQNGYRLETPYFAPAGSKLVCTAHFDNSERNLSNPDPTSDVRWGDQTWEEMMIGYFNMTLADQDLTKQTAARSRTEKFLEKIKTRPFAPAPFADTLSAALKSQSSLRAFGGRLRESIPQLDRMDWCYVENGKVHIHRVVQATGPRVLGTPRDYPAEGMGLAQYCRDQKRVVHQLLADTKPIDLRTMSRFFQSSVHLPFEYDGKKGILSFWSGEADAFQPEVVNALAAIARNSD